MKLFLLLTLPLYALDQATKALVLANIPVYGGIIIVDGFFNLVHTYNTGMAFGLMQNNNLFFIIISSVALVVLAVLGFRGSFPTIWLRLGAALLASGVLGNLTVRLLHGHVVDFLDFHIGEHHWPAFNVADSCICIAVGLFILGTLREETAPARQVAADTATPSPNDPAQ